MGRRSRASSRFLFDIVFAAKGIWLRRLNVKGFLGAALALLVCAGSAARAQQLPPMHGGVNTFPWMYRARTIGGDPTRFEPNNTFPNLPLFSSSVFKTLRGLGADFIRVPLEPGPFMTADATGRARLISTVVRELQKVTKAGMTPILDVAPRENEPMWKSASILASDDLVARYQDMLVDFATILSRDMGNSAVLELMNEPAGGWSWHDKVNWFPIQARLLRAVRKVAPRLPVVATGDRGGGIDGLLHFDPSALDDPAIIYSFHYYEPMVVTHQGATWTSQPWRAYLTGIPYPPSRDAALAALAAVHDRIDAASSPGEIKASVWRDAQTAITHYFDDTHGAATVNADFAKVSAWAKLYKIPPARILLGEFGVLRPGASVETAARYAHDVRTAAETAGFSWCYFNYAPIEDAKGGFSLHRMRDPAPDVFDKDMIETGLGWHVH